MTYRAGAWPAEPILVDSHGEPLSPRYLGYLSATGCWPSYPAQHLAQRPPADAPEPPRIVLLPSYTPPAPPRPDAPCQGSVRPISRDKPPGQHPGYHRRPV
jgi:hypothetical protein